MGFDSGKSASSTGETRPDTGGDAPALGPRPYIKSGHGRPSDSATAEKPVSWFTPATDAAASRPESDAPAKVADPQAGDAAVRSAVQTLDLWEQVGDVLSSYEQRIAGAQNFVDSVSTGPASEVPVGDSTRDGIAELEQSDQRAVAAAQERVQAMAPLVEAAAAAMPTIQGNRDRAAGQVAERIAAAGAAYYAAPQPDPWRG